MTDYISINKDIKFYRNLLKTAKTPHERDSLRCEINKLKRQKQKDPRI